MLEAPPPPPTATVFRYLLSRQPPSSHLSANFSRFPFIPISQSVGGEIRVDSRCSRGRGRIQGRPTGGRAGFGRTVELREGGRKEGGRTIPPPRIHNVCHDDYVGGSGGGGRFELRSHTNRFLPLGSLLPLPLLRGVVPHRVIPCDKSLRMESESVNLRTYVGFNLLCL